MLLKKTDVLKTSIFTERKFEEMHQLWREKWYKVYSGKQLFWHYHLQLSFLHKAMSQNSFNLFFSGDERLLYQCSLGNEVDFTDIMNVFPNISAKNWNFKKLRHCFVDERATIITTLWSSCHWKIVILFCLRKKIPEKAILTLTVNYRKIIKKKKSYSIQNNSVS